jgi:hypothetical protein
MVGCALYTEYNDGNSPFAEKAAKMKRRYEYTPHQSLLAVKHGQQMIPRTHADFCAQASKPSDDSHSRQALTSFPKYVRFWCVGSMT